MEQISAKTVKIIAMSILAFAFILITITSAFSLGFDSVDEITISPGQTKESFIVITDTNDIVTIHSLATNFITFDGSHDSQLLLSDSITATSKLLKYEITIPSNANINPYIQDIVVTENGQSITIPVKINVQGKAYSVISDFFLINFSLFGKTISIGILLLTIFSIIVLFYLLSINKIYSIFSSLNTFGKLLVALTIISIVFVSIFLYFETNIVFKQKGVTVIETIDVASLSNGEIGGGYMTFVRHSDSPSTADLLSFDNNEKVKFVSLYKDQRLFEKITIDIPTTIESGTYYYIVELHINQKTSSITKSFKIR